MSEWNLVAAGPSRERLQRFHLIPDSPVVTVNRAIDIADRGLPVHFAAFADGPRAVWEPLGLEKYVLANPTIQLWVSLRQLTHPIKVNRPVRYKKGVPPPAFLKTAAKMLPEVAAASLARLAQKYLTEPAEDFTVEGPGPHVLQLWDRILPASVGVRVLPHGNVQDVNRSDVWRHAFTTLCALERIWMFNPKRVRILCCDMAGTWIPGKTEEDCVNHEKEKVALGKSQVVLDRWRHEKWALDQSIIKHREKHPVEVEWVIP